MTHLDLGPAVGLWRTTKKTNWSHWIALSKPSQAGEKIEARRMDVEKQVTRRTSQQAVQGTILLAAIGGSALYITKLGWPLYLKPSW